MSNLSNRRRVPIPCAVTDGEIILATGDVSLPPERAFMALVTPEVEKWWGSDDTYHVTDWKADLKVGGKWSLVVVRPDGMSFPASGEFLELDIPRKIVLTRRYDWAHPTLGNTLTKVTYLLKPIEGGTNLIIRHEDFGGDAEAAFEHEQGWERYIGWLDDYGKLSR